jgi:hypothetical protein
MSLRAQITRLLDVKVACYSIGTVSRVSLCNTITFIFSWVATTDNNIICIS